MCMKQHKVNNNYAHATISINYTSLMGMLEEWLHSILLVTDINYATYSMPQLYAPDTHTQEAHYLHITQPCQI